VIQETPDKPRIEKFLKLLDETLLKLNMTIVCIAPSISASPPLIRAIAGHLRPMDEIARQARRQTGAARDQRPQLWAIC
jgi:hypothetical protein